MSEEEAIDEVAARIEEAEAGTAPTSENPEGFWFRLFKSLRVKISGSPPNKIEITGGTDF